MDLEAKAMGFHMSVFCWSSAAPNSYTEASAEIFVGMAGSYSASVVGVVHRVVI